MALGQIDPARLEGEALRRWYLRSPADVEEERRERFARSYKTFFSPPTVSPNSEDGPERGEEASSSYSPVHWEQFDDIRSRGDREHGNLGSPRGQKLAAAAPRGFWD